MTITSHQHALATGTLLMEYRLTGLLGAGAFGITYLARDAHLDKDVAIKEYLPSAYAARAADGTVVPITHQQLQDYRWGLERFSQEARTLARFSHRNIVRVVRYFELNGTGYMVMDYERGEPLKTFVQKHLSLLKPHSRPWCARCSTVWRKCTPRAFCTGTSSPTTSFCARMAVQC